MRIVSGMCPYCLGRGRIRYCEANDMLLEPSSITIPESFLLPLIKEFKCPACNGTGLARYIEWVRDKYG